MARADGNRDRESSASTHLAFDAQLAAVQLDELVHEREADARSLVTAPVQPLHTMEPLEDTRQLGLRNTRASIVNRKERPSIPGGHRDDDAAVSVNLNAFDNRFRTIFSHMSRST